MQTDPVGYEDQMNLYAYVHNDPLNYSDPNGEAAQAIGGCLAGSWGGPAGCAAGAAIASIAVVVGGAYIAEEIIQPVMNESSSEGVADDGSTVSDREPGSDGKRGSKGGPGEGKRFSPESPGVRESNEGAPCRYCGTETTNTPGQPNSRERDHIEPKSKGGNNSSENEGNSCRNCNRSKGARNPDEWKPAQ